MMTNQTRLMVEDGRELVVISCRENGGYAVIENIGTFASECLLDRAEFYDGLAEKQQDSNLRDVCRGVAAAYKYGASIIHRAG